ncbi:MAG: hypothetical protein ABIY50_13360 [Ignavibacteria bacterium]
MQNQKLINLLKSFDAGEFRQFRDFIYSPAFTKNKNVIALFEELKTFYPDFNSDKLTDENLFINIFKDEKFDYFKIKNTISDLLVLGKEFLSFTKYKKDNFLKEKFLLEELRIRNLDMIYEQTYKAAIKHLDETKVKDENYFLKKTEMTDEVTSFYSPKEPNVNFHLTQEKLDMFVSYSVTKLLKIYNIILHEKYQNNYDFNMRMFENIMDYLKSTKIENNPTLHVYYYIILLETEKADKYFYELKKLKKKYKDQLSDYDNYMIYLHMDGYCATAYNEFGRTDLLKEQFILTKENTSYDSVQLGKILYPDFLNQIKKAVKVNEFEWADDYIRNFKDNLTAEKQSTLNFCYGIISYKKGDLDEALDYFSKANFPNFIIKVQVKILLLQLYYEKKYYDQANSMIDTFRHYLSREKLIQNSIKSPILEFVKITGNLIKYNSGIEDKDLNYKLNKIKTEIENLSSNRFGIKLWLIERFAEIK